MMNEHDSTNAATDLAETDESHVKTKVAFVSNEINSDAFDESLDEEDAEAPQTTRRRPRWLLDADFSISLLVKFVVLFGFLFAIKEYHDKIESDQKTKTFEYIIAFEQGRVIESRENLREALGKIYKNVDPRMAQSSVDQLVLQNIEEPGGLSSVDIDRVLHFFQTVKLCIEHELCEPKLTLQYFEPQAKHYYGEFEQYIDDRRKDPAYPCNFAINIQEIAGLQDIQSECND